MWESGGLMAQHSSARSAARQFRCGSGGRNDDAVTASRNGYDVVAPPVIAHDPCPKPTSWDSQLSLKAPAQSNTFRVSGITEERR